MNADHIAERLVSGAVMRPESSDDRKALARALAAYALGAVAALEGKALAAEIAYRLADTTVGLK